MPLNNNKSKTPGERFLSWAKGISIIVATCIAVYAALKGNEAQNNVDSTWETLRDQVNKQNEVINSQGEAIEKLTRRMIFFQGHQEGVSAGRLFELNSQLEKQIDRLKRKLVKGDKSDIPKPAKPTRNKKPPQVQKPFHKLKPLMDKQGK